MLYPIIFGLFVCLLISIGLCISAFIVEIYFKDKTHLQVSFLVAILIFMSIAAFIATLGDKSNLI
ncbi:hypothetical protein [Bacillus wiedmannii]|uniref:hypothetical protein n=1 Tax=Bacillus wiedmannii TaxID=1890302 RepID=UPI000BF55047|nr:hypothetical protein [Bacillus wiedmannii]PEP13991.1 hypothetical protein CN552_15970 [Bacillus wiedmannii]